jgi:hypothetical protein
VILLVFDLNFACQLEGEAGSAEEQPVSNKVDANMIKRELIHVDSLSFYQIALWLKKLIWGYF